jgi:hypothetical protein
MNRLTQELATKARNHWEKWLPKKTKELKDIGQFYEALQIVAVYAHAEIAELMADGYQQREAEAVVLPLYILLEPEPLDTWEKDYSTRMEHPYQRACASTRCHSVCRR